MKFALQLICRKARGAPTHLLSSLCSLPFTCMYASVFKYRKWDGGYSHRKSRQSQVPLCLCPTFEYIHLRTQFTQRFLSQSGLFLSEGINNSKPVMWEKNSFKGNRKHLMIMKVTPIIHHNCTSCNTARRCYRSVEQHDERRRCVHAYGGGHRKHLCLFDLIGRTLWNSCCIREDVVANRYICLFKTKMGQPAGIQYYTAINMTDLVQKACLAHFLVRVAKTKRTTNHCCCMMSPVMHSHRITISIHAIQFHTLNTSALIIY